MRGTMERRDFQVRLHLIVAGPAVLSFAELGLL